PPAVCTHWPTPELYTLSLHDALPISEGKRIRKALDSFQLEEGLRIDLIASEPLVVDPVAFAFDEDERMYVVEDRGYPDPAEGGRSEEHTSELQSRENLVCRLLLEKKK